tara:strand:- start:49 stop:633 length:585 start_codon:yes stop_codon:yes gene_type:complete
MDHRVSKDMISSGMTPSGEKTQADLSRTQYGSAPSPSSLMDAYKAIYEHHQKDADGNVIPHEEKEELNEGKMPEGLKNYLMKKGKKEDKKEDMKKEDVDLFDLVKGKLIDEGCDEQEAIKIMVNISEEELNELALGTAGAIAGTAALAGMGINAIRKMNQNKKKMDTGGKFKPGSTMDNIQKKNQMYKDMGIAK